MNVLSSMDLAGTVSMNESSQFCVRNNERLKGPQKPQINQFINVKKDIIGLATDPEIRLKANQMVSSQLKEK